MEKKLKTETYNQTPNVVPHVNDVYQQAIPDIKNWNMPLTWDDFVKNIKICDRTMDIVNDLAKVIYQQSSSQATPFFNIIALVDALKEVKWFYPFMNRKKLIKPFMELFKNMFRWYIVDNGYRRHKMPYGNRRKELHKDCEFFMERIVLFHLDENNNWKRELATETGKKTCFIFISMYMFDNKPPHDCAVADIQSVRDNTLTDLGYVFTLIDPEMVSTEMKHHDNKCMCSKHANEAYYLMRAGANEAHTRLHDCFLAKTGMITALMLTIPSEKKKPVHEKDGCAKYAIDETTVPGFVSGFLKSTIYDVQVIKIVMSMLMEDFFTNESPMSKGH